MFNVILFQPEIPPNTGNIIRLCANTGALLHLIEPLGFQLDDSRLKRAGLDYHEFAGVKRYRNWTAFLEESPDMKLWTFSTSGNISYDQAGFQDGDGLVFGPETRGLPDSILDTIGRKHCLRLPMAKNSRSLNLSNTVAVGLYEAWRKTGFKVK
jgi:tRNA (cytidine/uridine-2'-O-)-methyltransferase